MAVDSRTSTELLLMPNNKHKWTPPPAEFTRSSSSCRKFTYDDDQANDFAPPLAGNALVPVVYYISRNGKLEHPHFILVPVSSSDGLYLRDVLNRLNMLRGNSMAYKYSWSSKRKYKSNGYVWQDLSEDDLIYPTNDDDYVLKGSEIPKNTHSFRLAPPNDETHCDNSSNTLTTTRTKNQSSTTNLQNTENHRKEETNRVYRCKSSRQLGDHLADAATQTDDRWKLKDDEYAINSVELSREELSPPPSTKSSSVDGMDGGCGGVRSYVDSGQLNRAAKNECNSTRRIAQRLMRMISSCKSSDSTKCYNSIENVSQEFLCNVQKGVAARYKRRL